MKYFKWMFLFLVVSCSDDLKEVTQPTEKFTVNIKSTNGGTVSSSGGSYEKGYQFTVTATPDNEFIFDKWSDGNTDNPRTITVNQNLELEAVFKKKTYPLSLSISGSGNVTEELLVQGTITNYNSGSIVRLTAVPEEKWVFDSWKGDIESSQNPIDLDINGPMEVEAVFIPAPIIFENRSPNYPDINFTSGNILTNKFHPGLILTSDIIVSNIDISENCDCTGCACATKYVLRNNQSRYIDYNRDGRTDLFGWLLNMSGGYGVDYGKYVLVDDVFNNPTTSYFDSGIWFAGRMEVNDFNGDGVEDILVFHQNDHGDNQGGHFTERSPLEIVYINNDGTLQVSQIGEPTAAHELTCFDIDLDGDIDIVNFEYYQGPDGTEYNTTPQVPLFYINDGTGNFTITDNLFEQSEFYKENSLDYTFTAVDSFDLDNDGYMDIITGNSTKDEMQYCLYDNPDDPYEQNCYTITNTQGIRILWGSSSGTYSEDRMTTLEIPYFSTGGEKGVLGFSFIDIDLDGFYEIVSTGFHDRIGSYGPYSGGFLDIYSNLGNRTFEIETNSTIDINEWLYQNKQSVDAGDIPLFYDIAIVDVDGDGDFDILPHTINTGDILLLDTQNGVDRYKYQTNIGESFHWKNNGGYFELNDVRKDYEN